MSCLSLKMFENQKTNSLNYISSFSRRTFIETSSPIQSFETTAAQPLRHSGPACSLSLARNSLLFTCHVAMYLIMNQ